MKKFLTILVIVAMIMSLFMTSALAVKPADKPPKDPDEDYSPDMGGLEPDDEEGEDEAEGSKKPNEKRDAKMLFKEETRPLIDEVHANREEWGALGDQQDMLGECIEAYINGIVEQGGVLDEATIAFIKEKTAEMKALKESMRGLKGDIHDLWKQYIEAKKASDVEAGSAALNAIIVIQEERILIRQQIVAIMNELCPVLGVDVPGEEPVEGEEGE